MDKRHNYGQPCTKQFDCSCTKCCLCYPCQFHRRSASLYRGMQSRFAAKKWKSGAKEGTVRIEKREIPFTLDAFRDWLRVVLEDTPFCEYCGISLTIMTITPDHAKPVSRGGSLDRKNLRPSCDDCNRMKGELLVGEFMALLKGLATFTEDGRRDIIKRLKGGILHFGSKKKDPQARNVLAVPAKKEEPF